VPPLHVFAAGRDEAGSVKGALLVRVYGASANTLDVHEKA